MAIAKTRGRTKADYKDFVHTGPGTLAGQYLRMFWQPVHTAGDLLSGRTLPIRLMGEDFTLYRGDSGTPHLVGFRCAHRGTQLSVGSVEGDCIRCFYHGWKYDGSGRCIEQPAEPQPFCRKIRIPSYPVREYLGLIFAYLGEGDPPPFPRYQNFEDPACIVDVTVSYRSCSYFQNVENSLDRSHVGFVHREFVNYRPESWADQDHTYEESDWGITTHSKHPDGKVTIDNFGMPNINYVIANIVDPEFPQAETLLLKVPVDDEHHVRFGLHLIRASGEAARRFRERRRAQTAAQRAERANTLGSGDEMLLKLILAGKLRLEDVDHNRIDFIPLQDDVAQAGQGVIFDRRAEHLGRSDAGIILLRKLWERELRALAAGRPIKRWTYRPELIPKFFAD